MSLRNLINPDVIEIAILNSFYFFQADCKMMFYKIFF